MTTTQVVKQVVEMSVTVNNNSPIQDYVHLDDHTKCTYDSEMTPGFKPFTINIDKYQEKNQVCTVQYRYNSAFFINKVICRCSLYTFRSFFTLQEK